MSESTSDNRYTRRAPKTAFADLNPEHMSHTGIEDAVADLPEHLRAAYHDKLEQLDRDGELRSEMHFDSSIIDTGEVLEQMALRHTIDLSTEYSSSSERLTAIWVEQTAIARTQIEEGNASAVRDLINEIDENLRDFDDGGTPPVSDDAYGIYTDAVVRSALPYGQPPITHDEVAQQLRNVGVYVPAFDPAAAAQITGIRALTSAELERSIHAITDEATSGRDLENVEGPPSRDAIASIQQHITDARTALYADSKVNQSTVNASLDAARNELTALGATSEDSSLTDVAAARLSVRRALASINDDGQAAQGHLAAANTALGSAIATLRPDTSADVTRAHESVQQAAANVDALTKTATDISKTDAPDLEQAARNTDAEVTIYSTPDCPGCFATKRALDKAGVQYDDIDLSKNPTLAAKFRQQGIKQAPIVETKDGDRWTGYQPGKLKEHGLDYRARQNRAAGTDTGRGVER